MSSIVGSMKLIAQVQLHPTQEQKRALLETLRQANAGCTYISAWAWEHRCFGHYALHRALYHEVRQRFGLLAQLAVRCFGKVEQAYRHDRRVCRTSKPFGGIAYDDRILRWHLDQGMVSISTLAGREHIRFVCGPRQHQLLASRQGESDLVLMEGRFYLLATCNVVEPRPTQVADYLGVDLGIANLATDSDGQQHSGKAVNGLRHRHARLRTRLQAKRSRSAKRLLKRR
ncbi:MAG: RNA-guided endonuclease TnpB family protein, partial [Candidatus Latescibacterota bacterium]